MIRKLYSAEAVLFPKSNGTVRKLIRKRYFTDPEQAERWLDRVPRRCLAFKTVYGRLRKTNW
jgi:IS30 family transposase